jgi:protein gp37
MCLWREKPSVGRTNNAAFDVRPKSALRGSRFSVRADEKRFLSFSGNGRSKHTTGRSLGGRAYDEMPQAAYSLGSMFDYQSVPSIFAGC